MNLVQRSVYQACTMHGYYNTTYMTNVDRSAYCFDSIGYIECTVDIPLCYEVLQVWKLMDYIRTDDIHVFPQNIISFISKQV